MRRLRIALCLFPLLLLPTKVGADSQFSVFEIICDTYVFQFSYGIRSNMHFLYPNQQLLNPPKSFFASSGETNDWITYTCKVKGDGEAYGYQEAKYELSYKQVGGKQHGSFAVEAKDSSTAKFDVLIKVKVNDDLIIPEISLFRKCIFEDSGAEYPWNITNKNFVRMTFMRKKLLEIYITRYGSDIQEEFFWETHDPIPYIPKFCGG